MKKLKLVGAVVALVINGSIAAGESARDGDYEERAYTPRQLYFDYARVISVRPVYREVEVSRPLRECRDEPLYHTSRGHLESTASIPAGHQVSDVRGFMPTIAMVTTIDARSGHEAANGRAGNQGGSFVSYEQHCRTRYRSSYEQVVDGYDVMYQYRGRQQRIVMPYDPGERIKMRIQITPVI